MGYSAGQRKGTVSHSSLHFQLFQTLKWFLHTSAKSYNQFNQVRVCDEDNSTESSIPHAKLSTINNLGLHQDSYISPYISQSKTFNPPSVVSVTRKETSHNFSDLNRLLGKYTNYQTCLSHLHQVTDTNTLPLLIPSSTFLEIDLDL